MNKKKQLSVNEKKLSVNQMKLSVNNKKLSVNKKKLNVNFLRCADLVREALGVFSFLYKAS